MTTEVTMRSSRTDTGWPAGRGLALIANARMPSQRAQSLQVAQVAGSFARAGVATRLLHARRFPTPELPAGQDLFDYYAVAPGERPEVVAVPCWDAIDRTPRKLQFVPARLQEWSFSKNAARAVGANEVVLSREIEAAVQLLRQGRRDVFLELHRLPGGKLRRKWLAEALEGVAGVVAISGGVARDVEALGVSTERLIVAHDGLDLSPYADAPTQAAARAAIDVPTDVPLVVYTGSLLTWKGVDLLVEAARLLPDVRFVIAGGMDADVSALRERAAGLENVRLDGFQPPERVPTYLVAGDVGVVPNRSQPAISAKYTSPLKLFESLGAGLPLVVSDLPSMRDVLEHGVDAWLVAPDSVEALATGIRHLLADSNLRYHLAKRGRKRAPSFSWDRRAGRLLDWFAERLEAVQ